MNWEALGALAEIIGSLAVLATLIYIGIQVRDAKRMNDVALRENPSTNIAAQVVGNPHLAKILVKIRKSTGTPPIIEAAMKEWELDAEEAEIWFRYMGTIYRGLEAQYFATGEVGVAARRLIRDPQSVFYFRHAYNVYDDEFIEALSKIAPDLLKQEGDA